MAQTWQQIQGSPGFGKLKVLHCCCLVAKLCPTLCDPMDCSARLPCPSLSPGVCSDSCLLSRWCYPNILFSVAPFSCPQSFPASGSFRKTLMLFHFLLTVRGVLKASILERFAIPSSRGPRFVRTLHCDLSVLGGPAWHAHWVAQAPSPQQGHDPWRGNVDIDISYFVEEHDFFCPFSSCE